MLGKHGNGAVDKIHACGAVFGFAFDNRSGFYVVGYIGNMHADFDVTVFEAAERQRVIEVFCIARVDGESHGASHVFACCDFFVGDARINFVGSFFNGLGIAVWQAEFGQNCMHFGGVLAGFAEHVHNFALGILCIIWPVGDSHYHFVAVCGAFEALTRYIYVVCQIFRVGEQICDVLVDFDSAYKCLIFLFDDSCYFGFGLFAFYTGRNRHLHTVAVESVHGVTFGYSYFLAVVVCDDRVVAVAAAHEYAFGFDCAARGASVESRSSLDYVAVESEFGKV